MRLQSHAFTKQSGTFISYMSFRKKMSIFVHEWRTVGFVYQRDGVQEGIHNRNIFCLILVTWPLCTGALENASRKTETLRCFTVRWRYEVKSTRRSEQHLTTEELQQFGVYHSMKMYNYHTVYICLSAVIISTILVLLKTFRSDLMLMHSKVAVWSQTPSAQMSEKRRKLHREQQSAVPRWDKWSASWPDIMIVWRARWCVDIPRVFVLLSSVTSFGGHRHHCCYRSNPRWYVNVVWTQRSEL